jgi:hypothetical protein
MARRIFAEITAIRQGRGEDRPFREFVAEFRGLSDKGKLATIGRRFPDVQRLTDLENREELLPDLLDAMQAEAKPPSAGKVGLVGEGHFRNRFQRWFGIKRFWYESAKVLVEGVPYVFEVEVAETRRQGQFFHGVNFSPTYEDPLGNTRLAAGKPGKAPEFETTGIGAFLHSAKAHPQAWKWYGSPQTAAAVHLVCPALEPTEPGKSRFKVPKEVAAVVGYALWRATKELYAEQKRQRRQAKREEKAEQERARQERRPTCSLVEAVARVMPEAVEHARGDEHLPVSAHTLYYSVRKLIQAHTTKELRSDYFEQHLLPAYQRDRGRIAGLYYEARGTLYEPHTGKAVPLGTREVMDYQFPHWLYDKILFVEKKGLWPVLEKARLAEKYDMAIIAGEGYATEACRVLFKNADKGQRYQLFTSHDADPFGYNIGRTLREATARMPGYSVEVIDLGLRLGDAIDMGLEPEEFTRQKAIPQELELTDLEREYFEGIRTGKNAWRCKRVELNAFTSPQLIGFYDRQLHDNGVRGKVIPPDAKLPGLTAGIFNDIVGEVVSWVLDELLARGQLKQQVAKALREKMPLADAKRWISDAIAHDPYVSWEAAVERQLRVEVGRREGAVRELVLRHVRKAIRGATEGDR